MKINKYTTIFKKFMLFSAGLHILIIVYFSIIKSDITYLNYFNILDLDLFFSNITNGFLSQLLSILTILLILLVIYIKSFPKIIKKTTMEFTLNKDYTYAVVGASNNPEKYGFKIVQNLKSKNFSVIPINPKGEKILGFSVFPKISDVPQKIDVVIFVVPFSLTEKILLKVKKLGIDKVWMQPGAQSRKAIQYCLDNNIKCIHDACVMIENL
jgi:uncharacterized protein